MVQARGGVKCNLSGDAYAPVRGERSSQAPIGDAGALPPIRRSSPYPLETSESGDRKVRLVSCSLRH